jgi:hypothetical protein
MVSQLNIVRSLLHFEAEYREKVPLLLLNSMKNSWTLTCCCTVRNQLYQILLLLRQMLYQDLMATNISLGTMEIVPLILPLTQMKHWLSANIATNLIILQETASKSRVILEKWRQTSGKHSHSPADTKSS